jgi:hypothetical protein
MDIDSLDDIELRTRAIQGLGPISLTPINAIPTPAGLSAISSIEEVENKSSPQFRPDLPFPKRNIMLDVIGAHLETERLANKGAKLFNAEIDQNIADIERLNIEKQEALEKEAEAVKSRSTWSTLSTIAQYIGGTASIILGYATWGMSHLAGALLMASGGLALFNRLGQDTPLFSTIAAWCTKSNEMQKKITANIEMGAFYLQMGFGLAGGIMAWQAGALAAAQAAGVEAGVTKAVSIVTTASGIVSGGAKVGEAIYNKKAADLNAQIRLANGQITTDQQTMYQQSSQLNRLIESAQAQTEELRKAIQALQIQIDLD